MLVEIDRGGWEINGGWRRLLPCLEEQSVECWGLDIVLPVSPDLVLVSRDLRLTALT